MAASLPFSIEPALDAIDFSQNCVPVKENRSPKRQAFYIFSLTTLYDVLMLTYNCLYIIIGVIISGLLSCNCNFAQKSWMFQTHACTLCQIRDSLYYWRKPQTSITCLGCNIIVCFGFKSQYVAVSKFGLAYQTPKPRRDYRFTKSSMIKIEAIHSILSMRIDKDNA